MKKNITGFLYFYVHFVVEVICFYFLSSVIGESSVLWLVPLLYDALAFVPQALIGYLSDKFGKIPFGVIGIVLMMAAILLLFLASSLSVFVSVVILCLGNACVHIAGAEVTLRSSNGKIAPSAVFVAGGSFGVITGKLLAGIAPFWFILILAVTSLPFILYAEKYRRQSETVKNPCKNFDYANKSLPIYLVVLAAVLVVIIRGYMGYGIPTAWNKTTLQTVALFVFMGIGKGLGGILCDRIGIRKTAIISVLGALPFLLFGDNLMFVSLIGVMLFSMTMSITLALLVSVLKRSPGFAFGLTTVGLFLGTAPIFFIKLESRLANYLVIIISTIICYLILIKIIKQKKGVNNNEKKK